LWKILRLAWSALKTSPGQIPIFLPVLGGGRKRQDKTAATIFKDKFQDCPVIVTKLFFSTYNIHITG
jgi:hypothetical protein